MQTRLAVRVRSRTMRILPVIAWFLLALAVSGVFSHEERKPTLILISFDGFRWDYLRKVPTHTLSWLAKYGVNSSVVNNFVTRTFPNHYSIVTGQYEENHGIINNVMWDPVYHEKFTPSTVDPKWFNASEPIWITNQKQGNGRLSAVINWVGGAVPIHGRRANFSPPFNSSIPFKARMDLVLQQLERNPPANFVAVYFDEPDASGHKYGPNSKQVAKAIQNLDNVTGYLVEELKKRHLLNQVNIILTSDHGMADVNSSKFVFLDDYISNDTYTLVDSAVNSFIIPHEGEKQNIYKNLSKAPHITTFYKEDIPKYWHYANNRRVTQIFVTSELGYRIARNVKDVDNDLGNHGYNNSIKEMHPFFIAYGPVFKQGYQSEPFSIVHIYSLMCYILGVTPAPNDGNLKAVSQMLRSKSNPSKYALFISMMVVAGLLVIMMVYGVCVRKRSPRHFRSIPYEEA
ncbi:ectonucleotide pyrophosphatase/phosphodiesterase family member 5-like [Dendronephthya gigantea]|uniref:ectonucleotide pyrophosphatase/phosphodiesterase family member 5-like n=1 Tax=Dendronephthya gigantea TaxID=151771 RepID=UPI00106918E2|nr:ectonucleotide pyrophosphatase/phosphodiesterase family member 5-like [Dendronephthya gigantea]